ncbi:carboxypeptidase-like regulatory domain-containing protein [Maribacter sp. ACAM166]|uniref:carboxypeptidase-like regulatory domain-containing protein n=1 Tax=Maribacter sp. ACAM166 TaxID=2508996 RepID=UPI0010FD2984|nr:carboxypeptidase-like regulatory domain-containing protein [Maribacter sp. ACAM166]TLP80978.1 hypothetical protein ES765_05905 [Maribacter sp. ACAM166]
MRSSLLILIFFSTVTAVGQTGGSKNLEGRVYSDDGDVAATHVLNLTTKRATITDNNGFFTLSVHLSDTLEFSAVQYKKKVVVVTSSILESKFVTVGLEDALTELDEVTVTPYNLSGDLIKDLATLSLDPVVTASTLGLPNAYIRIPTKAERELTAATANPLMSFDPLINAITGRTKMLKQRVARNKLYDRTERVRDFFADSIYEKQLRIPIEKIDDFLYYCEVDPRFQGIVDTHDQIKIWEYMRQKGVIYRANNAID